MKLKLLLGVCLISVFTNAQVHYDNNAVIELNMFDPAGKMPSDFTISKNSTFRYKLTNFNRSLYVVTINSTASSLFAEKPAIFNVITTVDVSKLTTAIDASKKTAPNAAPLVFGDAIITAVGDRQVNEYITSRSEFQTALNAFNANYVKVNQLIRQYNYLADLYKDPNREFSIIDSDKLNSTYNFLVTYFSYAGGKTDNDVRDYLDSKVVNLFNDLKSNYEDVIAKYAKYKIAYTAYQALATYTLSGLTENKKNLEDKIKSANDKKKEADAKTPGQTQFKGAEPADVTDLEDLKLKILTLNTEMAYETGIFGLATDMQTEIKTVYAKVETLDQNGFRGSMKSAYGRITRNNFEYTSNPIKGTKDLITVKIDIQPRDPAIANAESAKFNGDFTGHVTGWKINFSTGAFGIMGKKMFDQTYRLDPSGTDNVIIKRNENKNWITPAFGALMHFYVKRPGTFNWGGNFGLSISGDTHVNFHGGLSFIFGDEQRIILSLGPTLAQAKLITDQYTEDQVLPKTVTLNPVPTQGYYRAGWFFAITWNLSN